jgi:hypothetical protein
MKPTIPNIDENSMITFHVPIGKPRQISESAVMPPVTVEMLRITKDGFYYKGERVDDIHNVYERFHEWMALAERK